MPLKKPSQLFESNIDPDDNSKQDYFNETYDKFKGNLFKIEDLQEKIEVISSEFPKTLEVIANELNSKITKEELDNTMFSHLMVVDENFKSIKEQVQGINKKDLREFKNNVISLTEVVDNLVSVEIPGYRKRVTNTEVKISDSLEKTNDQLKEDLSKFSDIIDGRFEKFGSEISKTRDDVLETNNTYNKLYSVLENKTLKIDEKIENYSEVLEDFNNKAVKFEEEVGVKIEEFLSSVNKNHTTVKEKLENHIDNFTSLKEELTTDIAKTKSDIIIVEKSCNKIIDKFIKKYHIDIVDLKEDVLEYVDDIIKNGIGSNIERIDEKIKEIKEKYGKIDTEQLIQEGLLNISPTENNSDPLTPLDKRFVTNQDLKNHYRLFLNRIQQQLSTIGGGGETRLEFLDDVDRSTALINGQVLQYDEATKKWKGTTASGIGTQDSFTTSGIGTIGGVTIGGGTTALVVDGDAAVTGILTVGGNTLTLDGSNNIVKVGTALTLGHTQGLQFHTQNLHSTGFEVNQINASGIATVKELNVSGDGYVSKIASSASYFDIAAPTVNISSGSNVAATFIPGGAVPLEVLGKLKATDAEFSGNVSVGGTLTYEDVTNIDSVGFITARKGSVVLGSGTTTTTLNVSGVSTFVGVSTFSGDVYIGGDLYLSDDLVLDNVTGNSLKISGISTFTGAIDANSTSEFAGVANFSSGVGIADSIFHIGDTNTAIRFPSADTFTVETGGTEAIRVDSSQRLLIGHTATDNRDGYDSALQVSGDDVDNTSISIGRWTANAAAPALVLSKSRNGTIGSHTVVQDGDYLGLIKFLGDDGTDYEIGAEIQAIVGSGVGNDDMPTDLIFKTNGGSEYTAERLRITSAGNVGIGTTNPGAKVDVYGNVNVTGISTFTGAIDANGDLDVDGHTNLDNVNVSGVSTFASTVKVDAQLTVDSLRVKDDGSGNPTVLIATDDQNPSAFRIKNDTYHSNTSTGFSIKQENTGAFNLTGKGNSEFVPLLIRSQDGTSTKELLQWDAAGNATFGYALSVAGVGTFISDLHVGGQIIATNVDSSFQGAAFTGNIFADANLSVDGHTELDDVNVSGFSTFVGNAKFQDTIFTDRIKRYSDSGTTTKIILNDENINLFAGDHTNETLNVTPFQVTIPNSGNLNVTGVSTVVGNLVVGTGVTIEPNGQATFTGIVTFGSSSTTIDGDNNLVTVGTALTLGHTQGLQFHTQNLHATGFELNQLNLSGLSTFHDNVHLKDDKYLYFGNDDDSWVTFDGTNLQIRGGSSGTTYLRGNTVDIGANGGSGGFNSGILVTAAAGVSRVELYHDGNERLETTNLGVDVTGTLNATTFSGNITGTAATFTGNVTIGGTLTYEDVTNIDSVGIITARDGVQITADNKYLKIGEGNDISIVHTGGESVIANATGHLTRRSDVHKWENYNASTEYLRIASDGKVGIGTIDPLGTLHIQSNNPSIKITDANQELNNKSWNISAGSDKVLRIQAIQDGGGGGSQYFDFYRDGTKVKELRGLKSGNTWFAISNQDQKVGIGTTIPTAPLNVAAENSTGLAVRLRQDATNKKAVLYFQDYLTGGNDSWIENENSNLTVYGGYGGLLKLGVYNQDAITIDSNRLVGVGTVATSTSSTVALQVHDATEPRIRLTNNTTTADAGSGAELNVLSDDLIIRNRESSGDIKFLTGSSQNEALRITSAGNVGINTNNPLSGLHISDGTAYGTPQNASKKATLIISAGSEGSSDIQLLSANYNHIFFGDSADANTGIIWYEHTGAATDSMHFSTAGTERLRIDSVGRHGINVTNTGDYYSAADDLIIRETNGGDSGITIRTGTANSGLICFADGASSTDDQYRRGQIRYHHNNDSMDFTTAGNTAKLIITSTGQLQATSAADVRLTLGSSGTAGTNDSVHIRADSADLKFMAASGGTTIFETNGAEKLRIGSSGQIGLGGANYGTTGQVLTSQGSGSAPIWSTSSAGSAANEIVIKEAGSTVGSAGTVNFGSGLEVSALSNGQVTITTVPGSGVPGISTIATSTFKDVVVTGVSTLGSSNGIGTVTVGVGTTALMVDGHARVTGPLTIGSGSITLDGSAEEIKLGNTLLKRDSSTGDLDLTDNEGNYKTIKMKGGNAVTQSDAIAFAIALG